MIDWNVDQVETFIKQLNLGYESLFKEHQITGDVLINADHNLLKELGIKPVGHRLLILKHIHDLDPTSEITKLTAQVESLRSTLYSLCDDLRPLWPMLADYQAYKSKSKQSLFSPLLSPGIKSELPSPGIKSEYGTIRVYGNLLPDREKESYKTFKIHILDDCVKIIVEILFKYKIKDSFQNYALFLCYKGQELCLSFDQKPLEVASLHIQDEIPEFIIKHIKRPSIQAARPQNSIYMSAHSSTPDLTLDTNQIHSSPQFSRSTGTLVTESPVKSETVQAAKPATGHTLASPTSKLQNMGLLDPVDPTVKSRVKMEPARSATNPEKKPASELVATTDIIDSSSKMSQNRVKTEFGRSSTTPAKKQAAEPLSNLQTTKTLDSSPQASQKHNVDTTSNSSTSKQHFSKLDGLTAMGIYEYSPQRDDELAVNIGDVFIVLSKELGWFKVERDGRQGWVPSGCLSERNADNDEPLTSIGLALASYQKNSPNELSIEKGATVNVVRKYQHWLLVEHNNDHGWVPACYVSLEVKEKMPFGAELASLRIKHRTDSSLITQVNDKSKISTEIRSSLKKFMMMGEPEPLIVQIKNVLSLWSQLSADPASTLLIGVCKQKLDNVTAKLNEKDAILLSGKVGNKLEIFLKDVMDTIQDTEIEIVDLTTLDAILTESQTILSQPRKPKKSQKEHMTVGEAIDYPKIPYEELLDRKDLDADNLEVFFANTEISQ
jgi:hypothetical protein